jgi:hypothetical protein
MRLVGSGVIVLALASACGSAASTGAHLAGSPSLRQPWQAPPRVARSVYSATIHFGRGRESSTFTMREPRGVILLYRVRAPVGIRVRGTSRLGPVSAPLPIATSRVGPSSSCHVRGARITCTTGDERCPMPAGSWRIRLDKLAGPAGDVTIWFRVGAPSAVQAA